MEPSHNSSLFWTEKSEPKKQYDKPFSLHDLKTKNGYNMKQVVSALQKCIRRWKEMQSLFRAMELCPNYVDYMRKRLHVISTEDMYDDDISVKIYARWQEHVNSNERKAKHQRWNRLFVVRAVIWLCRARKSRWTDHCFFCYETIVDRCKKTNNRPKIPDEANDCHTKEGRAAWMTKEDFVVSEQEALTNKVDDEFREMYQSLYNNEENQDELLKNNFIM